ncbi:MAG TPA: TonB-dependent receptor [Acidobacteriaceae bacterium]|nr:TonB-dependent receptor [Acidobacteriaceae bacterium]
MKFKSIFAMVSMAGMLLLAGGVSRAQTITARVTGSVTDPSGAEIPNATITVKNLSTGVQVSTKSDQNGSYNFQFLPIGTYSITGAAQGFGSTSAGPLTLEIDQIARVDLKLEVGEVSTTVNVSDVGAVLQTQSSTVATTVTANTIENLPLSGNNFQVAAVFVPGAVLPRFDMEGGSNGFERNTNPATLPSFNGNRQQGNNYIMDGVEINEPTNNLIGYNPAPQALQEMRTITANADAEYGDVNGGEMVLVTKGGTNQFHGSVYEFYENQALTANLWSNNYNQLPKGVFHQNIFGATLGGPVLKDKLFFFVDFEGTRNNASGEGSASVATAKMRTGDFSELLNTPGVTSLPLYNLAPSATNPTGGWAGASAYPNNQIPINNSVAAYLFAHPEIYPLPNHAPRANTVDANNYQAPTAGVIKNNQGDIRVDWALDAKDSLMFRYSDGDAYDFSPLVVLPVTFPTGNDYPFHSGVVNWVHTFSPSLVNQARAGISRVQWFNGIPTDPTGQFGMNGNQAVGIPAPQAYPGFSQISLSSTESNVGSAGIVQNFLDNIFNYGDDLVWQHGRHTTKFGVQIVRYQQNNYYAGNYGALGQFIYDGTYTSNGTKAGKGYGFADFVLDQADTTDVGGVAGPVGQRQYRDAFYVQDDWKVLPNLTLNLGLRYGYDQPMYEVNDKEVNVDISKASQCTATNDTTNPCLMFAGQNGNSRALYEPFYGEVMPRIGFAWQFDPKIVVRGGYGITDFLEGTGANLRPTMNPPFFSQFVNDPAKPGSTSAGNPLSVSNGFSNGTQAAITQYDAWDKHLKPAMVQQFNLTMEFLLNSSTTAQMGYVGEVGRHLIVPASADQWTQPFSGPGQPPPSIVPFYNLVGPSGRVVVTVSEAVENYNALQATLRHRQSNGLEYTLNYTWSKSMTNNPGFYGISGVDGASAYWQNYYDPQSDYGQSGFDLRQSLNGTAVWQLPFGRGRKFGSSWNRATDEALGGWRLSGDVMLHTGFPINMTGSNRSNVHARTARANQYRPMKIVHQSVRHWFGTDPSANPCSDVNGDNGICAFGSAQPGHFGDAPPNNGPRAPGYRIIDMSLFKSFRTFEEQNLTFRVDAFNTFNMASYAAPTYVSAANGIDPAVFAATPDKSVEGEIDHTLSPARQFQLSLIYKF